MSELEDGSSLRDELIADMENIKREYNRELLNYSKTEAAANQWKTDAVELLAAMIGLMIAVGVTVGIIWLLYVVIKTIWLYALIGGICGYIGHKL